MSVIRSYDPRLVAALRALGINTDKTRRVVIDIKSGQVPVVHIEMLSDENVIHVVQSLDGIKIERKD